MPLTEEQKEALALILADAEAGDIEGFVPQATLTSRLADKDTKRKKELATMAAANATTVTERDEALARLRELDDEGKSAEQLRDQALTDANALLDAQKTLTAESLAREQASYQREEQNYLIREVGKLIGGSDVRALRPETALREALAENKFSVADPDKDGNFSLQLRKGELPVENIAEGFGDWYKTRKDLHAKNGTQLQSPGAGRPPGAPAPKDPLEGLNPGYSQFEKALSVSRPAAVPVVPPDQE